MIAIRIDECYIIFMACGVERPNLIYPCYN